VIHDASPASECRLIGICQTELEQERNIIFTALQVWVLKALQLQVWLLKADRSETLAWSTPDCHTGADDIMA